MDDFVGFSFDGVHSSTLGIIRTSDGSRYNQDLLPSFQDETVQVPGGEGTYYFGSNYKQRQFSISIAFDSLTEALFRNLIDTFGTKELKRLVFDEAPYKYYMVKNNGAPQLKYICFDEDGERIYKGEGTLNFIAYFPFARSVYKFLDQYLDVNYPNKSEWIDFAKLKSTKGTYDGTGTTINLFNAGQLESDFCAYFRFTLGSLALSKARIDASSITVGALNFSTMTAKGSDTYIRINSKTNLIEGCTNDGTNYVLTGNLYNSYIISGDFFKVPLGDSIFYATGVSCERIEYDYLYY